MCGLYSMLPAPFTSVLWVWWLLDPFRPETFAWRSSQRTSGRIMALPMSLRKCLVFPDGHGIGSASKNPALQAIAGDDFDKTISIRLTFHLSNDIVPMRCWQKGFATITWASVCIPGCIHSWKCDFNLNWSLMKIFGIWVGLLVSLAQVYHQYCD